MKFEVGDKVQVKKGVGNPWGGYYGEVIGPEMNGDVLVKFEHSGGYKDLPAADLEKK
jgi:hypothetical protein